jgi:tetratricopeptide (TPR) repeat protein
MVESDDSGSNEHTGEQSVSPSREITAENVLLNVERLRQQGNTYLQRGACGKAVRCYTRALELLERLQGDERAREVQNLEETEALLLSNRAAALFNLQRFQEALSNADSCIALRPQWPKAHRRRGQSLLHLGDFEAAADALQTAQQLAQEQWKKELQSQGLDADAIIAAYEQLAAENQTSSELNPEEVASLPPKPANLQEIEAVSLFAALLCDLQAAMFVLPPEPALSLLRDCPVFTITDLHGQPFFITDEDGEQICSFYFDIADAEQTISWIQSQDEELGKRAQIVSVDLTRALRMVADTQRERFERTLRRGLKDGATAGISACTLSTHAFQFRPSLSAVEIAVELWRAQEKALRENAGSEDQQAMDELEEITVENFNGIPIFQAKGLTLLQGNRQYVPLFFDKNDLDFAWNQLRSAAEEAIASGRQIQHPNVEFNVGVPVPPEQVPEQCEIDVGTLEDVLRRMAQAVDEAADEFSVILFVPSRKSLEYLKRPFPLDELAKSEEETDRAQSAFASQSSSGTANAVSTSQSAEQREPTATNATVLTPEQRKMLLQRLAMQRIAQSAMMARHRAAAQRAAATTPASDTDAKHSNDATRQGERAGAAVPAASLLSTSSEPMTAREIVQRGGDRETVRAYLEVRLAQWKKQQQEQESSRPAEDRLSANTAETP